MAPKLLAWRGNDKKLSKKQVKQVSKIVNKSKKYKMNLYMNSDNFATTTVNIWNYSTASTALRNIVKGGESYERQGDTIMLKHYSVRLVPELGTTIQDILEGTDVLTDNCYTFRIVVARIFGTYTGTPANYFNSNTTNAQFLVELGTVLYDKLHTFNTYRSPLSINVKPKMSSKKIPYTIVNYDDSTPVNVTKNDIVIFYSMLSSTPGLIPHFAMNSQTEIGYYDKY